MNTIFGIVRKDGGPVPRGLAEALAAASAGSPDMRIEAHDLGGCVLGCARWPGAEHPAEAALIALQPERGIAVAVDARLDGIHELRAALGDDARAGAGDALLASAAYGKWGDECGKFLLGDWTIAAWHARDRTIVIVRERAGLSPLFYFDSPDWFVFSSRLLAVAACEVVPRAPDDQYLTGMFLEGLASNDRTAWHGVRTLRAGHTARAAVGPVQSRRYWSVPRLDDVSRLDARAAAEGLNEVLGTAVRDRVSRRSQAAVALSGGLDSGAIAACIGAAGLGAVVTPFTHVPAFESAVLGPRVRDESPFAAATAARSGLRPLQRVNSAGSSPIDAVARAVRLTGGSHAAAAHSFFVQDLLAAAASASSGLLLVGQSGNETISWNGPVTRLERWKRSLREALDPRIAGARTRIGARRRSVLAGEMAGEASNISYWHAPIARAVVALDRRLEVWNELAGTSPLCVSDPTIDARVLAFCWSLDEQRFRGPGGASRWLVRSAMAEQLPADVLNGRGRGRQTADLIVRLWRDQVQVERALDACENGAALERLDIPRLRDVWHSVQAGESLQSLPDALLLCAAIQLGMLLNSIYAAPPVFDRKVVWLTSLTY